MVVTIFSIIDGIHWISCALAGDNESVTVLFKFKFKFKELKKDKVMTIPPLILNPLSPV